MIDRYDPESAPDAEKWLALDEGSRIELVQRFHRDARVPLPSRARHLHATLHTIVENQLALPEEETAVVRDTLARLMKQGLSRHDAIHAIGSVLAELLYTRLQDDSVPRVEINTEYREALEKLTPDLWLGRK